MSSPPPSEPALEAAEPVEAYADDTTQTAPVKNENQEPDDSKTKRRRRAATTGKKPTAEVLQRRKEGRIKAAATIAHNLKKTGIGRFESENGFGLTSVRSVPLINQKNYFTDYLKKDEQISFIRNWRNEKLLQLKLKNLKKAPDDKKEDPKNFDEYDLNGIKHELEKKKAEGALEEEEEEEEEEDDDNEEISEEKAKQGFDTVIIHPGSANIRLGRATDAFPKVVPAVVAVRDGGPAPARARNGPLPHREVDDDGEVSFGGQFDDARTTVSKDFKARMRYYKRRILPNSREGAANFNKRQSPEAIPEHNDPSPRTWVSDAGDATVLVGEHALNLPTGPKFTGWTLRRPLHNGRFNDQSSDYRSPQEILGDLANLIVASLTEMDITNLSSLKAILVIPDLYDKMYVETWVDTLFRLVGFGKVAILQEAVLASFGAGASSACVVDVGAQTTSVACVDEGMVINDSRVVLDYGGDDITKAFIKLLLENQFPFKDIDLSSKDDWELAQSLKESFVTFNDADIAVQLYNFYRRKPFETTQKYEFKVFDEVMLAPMGVFYPELFEAGTENGVGAAENGAGAAAAAPRKLFSHSTDQYSTKPNNPYSKSQENLIRDIVRCNMVDEDLLLSLQEGRQSKSANPFSKPKPSKTAVLDHTENRVFTSLEKAIIESITEAGVATDFTKARKLYDNLLIVGGGVSKIPGFDLILSDRINIWRPKFLSVSTIDEVLDVVAAEKTKLDAKKQQLIDDLKTSKRSSPDQPLDEVELTDEELEDIAARTRPQLNWNKLDALSDKGTALPATVLPPPRELDPTMLTWKGGSVYGRLKVVNEMWITGKDWDLLQSRSLYYKSIFNY